MKRWVFPLQLLTLHVVRRALVLVVVVAATLAVCAALRARAQPLQRPEGQGRSPANESNETNEGTEDERPAISAMRVPCDQVLSRVNHEVGLEHGRSVDMSMLAKRMHTTVVWVERCMLAAGRRPLRPGMESAETREEGLESFEDAEPEEIAPEDIAEPGAREYKEHAEKERVLRVKPPPTPSDFGQYDEGN